jgi:putative oxidoreductase
MRIVVGFTYWTHGAQKLFGWFGGFGPDGGTVDLATRFGAAGIIEFTCGLLIMVGLFTRPFAFIASGEMAVAYLWMHVPRGGFWHWANRG